MKIFGLYITSVDYAELYNQKRVKLKEANQFAERTKRECEEVHVGYSALKEQFSTVSKQNEDLKETLDLRDDDIKELRSRLEDLKSYSTELSERLEKEMSDNCELQNLYSEKCKECETLKTKIEIDNITIDDLIQKKEAFAEKLKAYEQDGYVVVKEDHYNQLRTDAEKFREEREKHNANRRKRRAAKKVAHAKPDTAQE